MSSPEDVQAHALTALAAVAAASSSPSLARLVAEVVTDAVAHPSPAVRRGAYAAAGRLPNRTAEQLVPLVVSLRNPDPAATSQTPLGCGVFMRNPWHCQGFRRSNQR